MSETGTSLADDLEKTSMKLSTKTGNIRSEKSEISPSFSNTEISRTISRESSKLPSMSKTVESVPMDSGKSPVIRTPRSRLAIPSIKELERPGTSYNRRETSKSEKLAENSEMSMSEIHQDGIDNLKNTLAQGERQNIFFFPFARFLSIISNEYFLLLQKKKMVITIHLIQQAVCGRFFFLCRALL